MEWFVNEFLAKEGGQGGDDKIRVLDVGSYDVNGSYRQFFPDDDFDYTGLDMAPGPNVDIALTNPYDWGEIPDDSFDVVVSGQAFEHIEFFWLTLEEMTRVLKKDGIICIIAPLGFKEHRHPVDCYRFFTDGMVALARYVSLEILHAHTNSGVSKKSAAWFSADKADSMLVAKKSYAGAPPPFDRKAYSCTPAEHKGLREPLVSMAERQVFLRSQKQAGQATAESQRQAEKAGEDDRSGGKAVKQKGLAGNSRLPLYQRILRKLKSNSN